MDLKKMGLEELSYEEATHIDGGGLIAGLTAAVFGVTALAAALSVYIIAVTTAFLVPGP